MIKVCPYIIRMLLVDVFHRLRCALRDELALWKAAAAESSLTRLLVSLQLRPNDHRFALLALHTNVAQQTLSETAPAKVERLRAAQRARRKARDARGAEQMTAREAFIGIVAHLFTHGTVQFVFHVEITQVLVVLQIKM